MSALSRGLYAALATPADETGSVNLGAFSRVVDFAVEAGVSGIVIGGATGEYASFSVEERASLIREAIRRSDGRASVLAAIGCQTLGATLRLGTVAAEEGCAAALVPAPHFFRYQSDDVAEYCSTVSRRLTLPCLLYHLPAFTNGLDSADLVNVLRSEPHLAGIKDSSGDRTSLALLANARRERHFQLFVGDDSLALEALGAGWDGVISGLACFVPELLVKLVRCFDSGDQKSALACQLWVDELIVEVSKFPVPWAIRIGLELRGISTGPLPLPLSKHRKRQVAEFRDWLSGWLTHVSSAPVSGA